MEKEFKNTPVPAPGFGTYQLLGETAYKAVVDALSIGYRHIDTAQVYENEDEVGRAIKNSEVVRDDIFLTSKVWYTKLNREEFRKHADDRLRVLGTDYLDLLLIHWPTPDMDLEFLLGSLDDMKKEGKIRQYGVSNFTAKQLKEAIALGDVFTEQVEYHPLLDQSTIMDICAQHDMMFTAYTPIAKGDHLKENRALMDIANELGKTPQQVALRWHLQQEQVVPIPRSSSHEHRVENFDVLDWELSDEQMDRIFEDQGSNRLVDPEFSPNWGEE